jgi:hypothetical protein
MNPIAVVTRLPICMLAVATGQRANAQEPAHLI